MRNGLDGKIQEVLPTKGSKIVAARDPEGASTVGVIMFVGLIALFVGVLIGSTWLYAIALSLFGIGLWKAKEVGGKINKENEQE